MYDSLPLIYLGLAWLAYFIMHSLLASLWLKGLIAINMPSLMPWYRLIFNGFALLALLPILQFINLLSGEFVWAWSADWLWLSYSLAALSVVGFMHSLKFYDMQEFIGIRQLKEHSITIEDQEHLQISPYHRFVRHPWYFFAVVLIWTRNMDTAWLLSSLCLTAYFWLGSKLEDRKLIQYYGDSYALYARKVNAIFPLPWKHLSVKEAIKIQTMGNS